MTFKAATVKALILSLGGAAAFSSQMPSAFVPRGVAVSQATTAASLTSAHGSGCPCCSSSRHSAACACAACRRSMTMLFSEPEAAETPVAEEAVAVAEAEATPEVPAAVASLDGVESSDEAHNVERPARKALKKKPKGKALSEFAVGDSVAAKVKTITNYGAFLDIGASTDGLLHISQLATEFVSDVSTVLSVGQEVEVRITGIDEGRNQVALTLLTADQEEEAKAAQGSRPAGRSSQRRDDGSAIAGLSSKGWKTEQFIEGTVVSTVDFGAFVRINVNQLNAECEGEIDGLVHISALSAGRASSVTDFVNVDDKVQVRLKAIGERNKVSLTMVSVEDEAAKREQGGGGGSGPEPVGNREWREAVKAMEQPAFTNGPVVVDMRA